MIPSLDVQFPMVIAQAGGAQSLGGLAVPMIGIFAIMYFLIFRPQQQEAKKLQETISSLKKGDDVVTQGGLIGKVFAIADKTVTLEVASGVKLRVLKSAVTAKGAVDDTAPKTDDGSIKKSDEAKKEEK